MKQNGFTLVELLATLAIISIIMMIAVPNVMGILDRNKRTTYLEDAKKLVTQADYKFRMEQTIAKPKGNECVVFRMKSLDVSELKKGPEGSPYNVDNSFVAIKYEAGKYQYGVMLYEANKQKGVKLVNSTKLNEETAMMKYIAEGITPKSLALNGSVSGDGFSCTKIISLN